MINSDPMFTQNIKNTVKYGLKLIINNNVFDYDNQIYKQVHGAPMSSPTSGLLAEFILCRLENIIKKTIRPSSDYCFRYVDGIFII